MEVRIGCCGFAVAHGRYYRSFPLVEIQHTFYKPPRLDTARRWRGEAPEEFEFTLKAWQLITHEPSSPTYRKAGLAIAPSAAESYGSFRPTAEVYGAWEATTAVAAALNARRVLFQCPPSFDPSARHVADLRRFFLTIARADLLLIWEPRGAWPEDTVGGLCRELDLVHGVDPLRQRPLWGREAYFRLHGRAGYRYRYTDEDLAELVGALPRDRPCRVLFNNTSMFEDARRLRLLLQGGED